MMKTNQAYIEFLADTGDTVLLDIIRAQKADKTHVEIDIVKLTCKSLNIEFNKQEFLNSCLATAQSRGLLKVKVPKQDLKAKPVAKPIPHDPQALYVPREEKPRPVPTPLPVPAPAVLAPVPAPIVPKPTEEPQPAKKPQQASPAASKTGLASLPDRLASMDDHTLLGCIRVFLTFPAAAKDVYITGVLMREWQEACWDEAFDRNLDDQLEDLESKVAQEKEAA